MSSNDIYKEPLVQHLLDQIPSVNADIVDWNLTFPISKKIEDKGRCIIAGYASVEVIDSQNELIPIPVLKEAWAKFRKNKNFYFGSLMHSNVPVIKILDKYVDSTGQVWKSGVDENGLFIVAEVRQDIEKGKQTWELIQKDKLGGFSIGGEGLASTTVCEGQSGCYSRVDKMELHEIAVVDKPANAPSIFKIVKRDMGKEELGEGEVSKEVTEEGLQIRLIELLEERKGIAEKLTDIANEKRKKDQAKLDMLYSEIKAIENSLNEKQEINKSKITKEMTEEDLRKRLIVLIKERKRLSEVAYPERTPEQKKVEFELELLYSQIKAVENAIGERLINKSVEFSLEKLDVVLKRLISKPFAGYKDMKDCIAQNSQARDPAAYCASIMHQVEGKKIKYIECPVDDTINKTVWKRIDTVLDKLIPEKE